MHLPWRDVAPGDGPVISTSVTPEETAVLTRLAAGAGDVLEIGSAFGYSAIVMALAGAHVTAVDPHTWIPDSLAGMERNLVAYGVADRVTIQHEYSDTAMPALVGDQQFGLIFIDGDHSAALVRHDILEALGLLMPGGVLAVHDVAETCCCPDVGQVTGELFPEGGQMVDSLLVVRP